MKSCPLGSLNWDRHINYFFTSNISCFLMIEVIFFSIFKKKETWRTSATIKIFMFRIVYPPITATILNVNLFCHYFVCIHWSGIILNYRAKLMRNIEFYTKFKYVRIPCVTVHICRCSFADIIKYEINIHFSSFSILICIIIRLQG